MLSIQLPHIAVQRVSNGYVVQWQKKNELLDPTRRTKHVEAVCTDGATLLAVIEKAAADISAIND